MKRLTLIVCMVFGAFALTLTTACKQEVRTVERKVTVQESEPRMVSPGTEVLE
jgi:hypothetical protein